jgi:hypothetical protein
VASTNLFGRTLKFSRFARNNRREMNETNEYIKKNNINETNDKLNGRVAKIKHSIPSPRALHTSIQKGKNQAFNYRH